MNLKLSLEKWEEDYSLQKWKRFFRIIGIYIRKLECCFVSGVFLILVMYLFIIFFLVIFALKPKHCMQYFLKVKHVWITNEIAGIESLSFLQAWISTPCLLLCVNPLQDFISSLTIGCFLGLERILSVLYFRSQAKKVKNTQVVLWSVGQRELR